MEVIGGIASVAQLINLTTKTIKYLNSIKDASRDRASLLRESSSLLPLLVKLQDQINDAKQGDPWFDCVRSLSVEHGPLDQLRDALEQLVRRLKPKKGIQDIARVFVWKLDKACSQDVLGKIERVQSRSILASVIVDYLRNFLEKTTPVGVAAIFFNFKEKQIHTIEDLLAALCVQLMQNIASLPQQLIELHNSHSSKGMRPGLKETTAIFENTIPFFDKVYVVLDALDESSEVVRRLLLPSLKALPSNVQLLITTRHIDEIAREFPSSTRIEIRASRGDLKRYIKSRIASSSRLARFVQESSTLEQEVSEGVISNADGM
ncbi:MAG: hypothetical protein Q9222_005025 [Ikaeria aurantiellina]